MTAKLIATKEEKYQIVAEAILKCIASRGINSVSHTTIARAAGVSRPWLYSYVGKTKPSLILLAAKHIGEIYAGFERNPVVKDETSWIDAQMIDARDGIGMARQYPWLVPLYFRFRDTQNPFGQVIAQIQKIYFDRQTQYAIQAFNVEKKLARVIAEFATDNKTGIEYRYSIGPVSPAEEKIILERTRSWLHGGVRAIIKV